jgi:molecular chaperone HtpG
LLVQSLMDFEGKKLKSLGKGTIKLGSEEEQKKTQEALQQKEEETSGLLQLLQKSLDEHVKQVRLTTRLVTSPACLVVGAEIDHSPQIERLLMKGRGGGPKQRRVLELNPNHELFTRMLDRYQQNSEDESLGEYAELLLGYSLLAEGSDIPDPTRFNRHVVKLMLRTL